MSDEVIPENLDEQITDALAEESQTETETQSTAIKKELKKTDAASDDNIEQGVDKVQDIPEGEEKEYGL